MAILRFLGRKIHEQLHLKLYIFYREHPMKVYLNRSQFWKFEMDQDLSSWITFFLKYLIYVVIL